MNLLQQLRHLLADFPHPWALCGGYALELFAGRSIRPHSDVDVCLPEACRAEIITFLLEKGWRLCEYRGMGKVKPLCAPSDSEPGRNLMALLPDCPLVEFFPREEEGLLYHRFHPRGMTDLIFLDLLFSAEMPRLIRISGLPVIAPETALMYKAASPEEPSAQADYAAVYPLLDDEQKAHLRAALDAHYPSGHPWNQ